MRSYEEYHRILTLWDEIPSKKAIARITGIPRGTVMDCIKRFKNLEGLETYALERGLKGDPLLVRQLKREADVDDIDRLEQDYAYLFGLYLGDGDISTLPRTYRLRIALDKKYPNIIQACVETTTRLMPQNSVNRINAPGCIQVSCYSTQWPEIFPQHGDGPKHKREIAMTDWQRRIVDLYPLDFWRGLYHSDGSRYENKIKGFIYPRYEFTNVSIDIQRMFRRTCDALRLRWTATKRKQNESTYISKRDDVAWLDAHVGAKS